MQDPLPATGYDAVFSVSVLHHLPRQDALRRVAAVLPPGGVLATVGIPRHDLIRELPVRLVAVVGQHVLAAAFAVLVWHKPHGPEHRPDAVR